MTRLYLLTIKKRANRYTSILELDRALALARGVIPRGDFHDFVGYELDSICRMHIHTMFRTPNQISCKRVCAKLNSMTYMHFHIQPFKLADYSTGRSYCLQEKSPHVAEEKSRHHFLMRSLKYRKIV